MLRLLQRRVVIHPAGPRARRVLWTALAGWLARVGHLPLFQVAGCYALEVSWSGGSWRSVFAAGS
jgi:hypothetical protein